MQSFQIPSHGAGLNSLMYIPAGAGAHPVVVLLHGFPGNEKNLDLAQAIRRAGWDVLYFDYRGAWGTKGDFSFTHSMEDTQTVVAYLRDPANAAKLASKPMLVITSDDGLAAPADALVAALQAAGDQEVNAVHIATDHSYSGKRIELTQTVLGGLAYLTQK